MDAVLDDHLDRNSIITHQVSPATITNLKIEQIQETHQSDNSPFEATVSSKLEIGPAIHLEEPNLDAPGTT